MADALARIERVLDDFDAMPRSKQRAVNGLEFAHTLRAALGPESPQERPCDRCGGVGYYITNALWAEGTEPHRLPCEFCNTTGIEPQ